MGKNEVRQQGNKPKVRPYTHTTTHSHSCTHSLISVFVEHKLVVDIFAERDGGAVNRVTSPDLIRLMIGEQAVISCRKFSEKGIIVF